MFFFLENIKSIFPFSFSDFSDALELFPCCVFNKLSFELQAKLGTSVADVKNSTPTKKKVKQRAERRQKKEKKCSAERKMKIPQK